MATRILCIDDDSNICDLLCMYLQKEGYEVRTACDGQEGLSLFRTYEPDLVLLDIMMPRMDGWQVCQEIRKLSSKPIIMVTAVSARSCGGMRSTTAPTATWSVSTTLRFPTRNTK